MPFWHETPLRRGVTYELFIVRTRTWSASMLADESLAFHEPTRHTVFEVKFKGTVPEQVGRSAG